MHHSLLKNTTQHISAAFSRTSGLNAYAVYPETRHLPNRVRRLIDFLKQKFTGKPYWD
ncbi:MAG: hypothetical protein L3J50_00040 [Emcibacter sp.]|nr:hypothetical protein [Emcibacter sp.]